MHADFAQKSDVEFVINNLCKDTEDELKIAFGENYKSKLLEELNKSPFGYKYAIILNSTSEIVGLFGIVPLNKYSAGIYLLTTENLHKGNIITFIRQAKLYIKHWGKKYKLLMDTCYKRNKTIIKWLKILGFKPSEYQNNDLQIWYKGEIKYYD